MKALALAATGMALAGCTVPTYYLATPSPIVIAPPPLLTPYTAPNGGYQPVPLPYAEPEPPPPETVPSDPATYETPNVLLQPLPDTVETPPPEPGRPAIVQAPPPPDPGGAVPMMGFRPMKGQKVPTP